GLVVAPLFPYTTLFRSGAGDPELDLPAVLRLSRRGDVLAGAVDGRVVRPAARRVQGRLGALGVRGRHGDLRGRGVAVEGEVVAEDRKSTRLNSSHVKIS